MCASFRIEATTDSLLIKIRSLETSQDWPQFEKRLQEKLEYYSLYRYIENNILEPVKAIKDSYSCVDK